MGYFVFRNDTVERFFPKDYTFSGYGDISFVPEEADVYVWFYQLPIKYDLEALVSEVLGFSRNFDFILERINSGKTLIALTMSADIHSSLTEIGSLELSAAIAQYNQHLIDASCSHTNVKAIDFGEFSGRYGKQDLIDWKFYFISQMSLNPRIANDFKVWWNKKINSIALKRKKCLVLDLDNTLWGGILGEDGADGIKIGGDYPGKAFYYFQKALLELSKTGIILTVCSKNNEKDVFDLWENNPFIILKKNQFAAWRINWNDKAGNIKELAEELNIGLDSMVFVDDNPTERELIRQMLPMVSVPEFPDQPYGLPAFFEQLVFDYFKVYSITEEDRQKTLQYKANAARAQARNSFADFSKYLESLDIHISIEQANDFNIPRIAQMTQKTNQFNLTTRRYTDADIHRQLSNGWKIWCINVSDRFGDNGISGCIFINDLEIDSLLLSCRILGKGIETAFVKTILSILKDKGQKSLSATYIPTIKNSQVKDFYEKCGFNCTTDSEDIKEYTIELKDADLSVEKYYHIDIR